MAKRKIDPREFIPETQPRPSAPLTPRALSHFRRFLVNLRDLDGINNFRAISIAPCNVLRVISPVMLEVRADEEVIVDDSPIRYRTTGTSPDGTLNPQFSAAIGGQTATTLEPITLRGGFDVTLRRTVHKLSLRLLNTPTGGPPNEFGRDELSGCVEIFVGSGAIDDMSRGHPMGHTAEFAMSLGGLTTRISGPVRPLLHGDDAGRSLGWVPSISELWGISLAPDWTGAAGVILSCTISQAGQGGYLRPLVTFFPYTATIDRDFTVPVPYYPWQSRQFVAGTDNGALIVSANTSLDADSIEASLRFRSWL